MKHEGRVLAQPPVERGSHASEEKHEGRILTQSAERDSRVLELKYEGRVLVRP